MESSAHEAPETSGFDTPFALPAQSAWLITTEHLVGRINTGVLCWWDWRVIVDCQVELTAGKEHVQLDPEGEAPGDLVGTGIAPWRWLPSTSSSDLQRYSSTPPPCEATHGSPESP